jgi:hypothetical protein
MLIDKVIAYEAGELNEDETLDLFQQLVDTGMIRGLQGHYGRTAQAIIDAGLITLPTRPSESKVGTYCECGAAYDEAFGGYACAR